MTYDLIWLMAAIHHLSMLIYCNLRPLCSTGSFLLPNQVPFKVQFYSAVLLCQFFHCIDQFFNMSTGILIQIRNSSCAFYRTEYYVIHIQITIRSIKCIYVIRPLHNSLNAKRCFRALPSFPVCICLNIIPDLFICSYASAFFVTVLIPSIQGNF